MPTFRAGCLAVLISTLASTQHVHAGQAQGVSSNTPSGPATYFQIENCTGRQGVAVYYFTNLPGLARMDISDVCLMKSGDLTSIEPIKNLTVVRQQDWSDQLEDVSVGSSSSDRRRVKFRNFTQKAPAGYGQHTGSLEISHGPDRPTKWGASEYWAKGYAFNEVFENTGETGKFTTYAELFAVDYSGVDHGISGPVFMGEITFQSGLARASFEDYGGTSKSPKFNLELSLADSGKVSGSAELYFENSSVAGLGPTSFKSSSFTFEKFVGHVAGAKGRELKVLGIGKGTYVDQTGTVRKINASIELSGYILE